VKKEIKDKRNKEIKTQVELLHMALLKLVCYAMLQRLLASRLCTRLLDHAQARYLPYLDALLDLYLSFPVRSRVQCSK